MKQLTSLLLVLFGLTAFGQDAMYDICPIKNSQAVPEATVYDLAGKEVALNAYIGERPVIVVFYRGGWCPYCTRHLSALQEVKVQIDSLGFELIAITPDDFSKLDSSVVRSEGAEFQLFSDKNLEAITAFGIGWRITDELYTKYRDQYGMDIEWWTGSTEHTLPVPAVFMVVDGKIQYQHVDPNYRKRLSPELLISWLKAEG